MRRGKYLSIVGVRVEADLPKLIKNASRMRKQSSASYTREAIIERLERDGFLRLLTEGKLCPKSKD